MGNGASVTLDVSGYELAAASPEAITLQSGATVSDFWIAVGSFRLQGGAQCGANDEGKLVFGGPIIANLAQADAAPGKTEPLTIPAGPQCRLRVDLEPVGPGLLPTGAPANLEGAVLYVRGERADGVPFIVRSSKVVDLRLEARGGAGFELDGDVEAPQALVVAFDMEDAITELELDELEPEPIMIDEKSNVSRLAAFENALHRSVSLFEDDNADGVLVNDESSPGQALAAGAP